MHRHTLLYKVYAYTTIYLYSHGHTHEYEDINIYKHHFLYTVSCCTYLKLKFVLFFNILLVKISWGLVKYYYSRGNRRQNP